MSLDFITWPSAIIIGGLLLIAMIPFIGGAIKTWRARRK